MPRVVRINREVATLFDLRDFVDYVDKYMGYEAGDWLKEYVGQIESEKDDMKSELEEYRKENEQCWEKIDELEKEIVEICKQNSRK